MYEVDESAKLRAQVDMLTQRLKQLETATAVKPIAPSPSSSRVNCQFCGACDHTISACHLYLSQRDEQEGGVNYMNNYNQGPRNDPYSNTYNPGWAKHPNFSYNNNNQGPPRGPPEFHPPAPQNQNQKPSWESFMESVSTSLKTLAEDVRTQGKSLKALENQVAQSALNVPRPAGQLPGQPEANPKGQVNVVTLRSGKELESPPPKSAPKVDESAHEEQEVPKEPKEASTEEKEPPYIPPPPYKPPLPFPQRRAQAQLDQQYRKFVDVLKKLYINIPFTDALKQMPSYVKFLKEILSNKRKLDDCHSVSLSKECSAILQNKLPPKLKDPGSRSMSS